MHDDGAGADDAGRLLNGRRQPVLLDRQDESLRVRGVADLVAGLGQALGKEFSGGGVTDHPDAHARCVHDYLFFFIWAMSCATETEPSR